MRLFRRHWAGDLSLTVSFFAISLVCTAIMWFYTRFAVILAGKWLAAPQRGLVLCLISLVLIWSVTAWQYGGTLRAARRYRAETPGQRGAITSGAMMTVLTILIVPIVLTSKTLMQFGAEMLLRLLGVAG